MKRAYTENRRKTNQKWYLKNREKVLTRTIEYQKKNRDKANEANRRYRQKYPNKKREERLKREFGITLVVYQQMFNEQNGCCKICYKPETRSVAKSGKINDLAVDHCHTTGKIRGLLCGKCNTAIGLLNEDENILNNCIEYLKKGKENV